MTESSNSSGAARWAAELIGNADALVVAAGAGMGVDSGLPDFRGSAGLWRAYPALARARLAFEEVASPATFKHNPQLAWGFYGHRLKLYRETVPHGGFDILQRWARTMPHGCFVYTSNVDGQFQRAGFDTDRVHECHGSIHVLQCSSLCGFDTWSARNLEPLIDDVACHWLGPLPTCPGCGRVARPNILMFGDSRWADGLYAEQRRRLTRWLQTVERPVIVELGAGTQVPTVRMFSEWIVKAHAGRLVRINPREPQVPTEREVSMASGALQGLLAIDTALQGRRI